MDIFQKIKNLFNPIVRELWEIFKQVFAVISAIAFKGLKETITRAILEVQDDKTILTDEAKKKTAIIKIKAELKQQGKDIKDHILNLLLEVILSHLKANKPK